jgi:hypothetical protein
MTSRSNRLRSPLGVLMLLLAVGVLPSACKDDNVSPSDDDDNTVNPGGDGNDDNSTGGKGPAKVGGSGNSGGSTSVGGNGPSSGGLGGAAGDGNTGGSDASGGTGGGFQPPPGVPDCEDEPNGEGCWDLTKCNGVKSIQFLEQCDGNCQQAFDNEARIEGFDGTLPPLT